MPSTTHPEFGANTEALDVAAAFADNIKGKTVLVTGVNRRGIGFTTAQAFASQSPAHVILAGRNVSKLQECIDALKPNYPDVDLRILEVDLGSQESVRAAAASFMSWSDVPTVDFLVNSAAVMGYTNKIMSKDGIEIHFATNHIGHWLLACLIMPRLIKAAEGKPRGSVRIINVASMSPTGSSSRWSDVNFEKKNKDLPPAEEPEYERLKLWGYIDPDDKEYIPLDAYDRSKVANVLFGIAATKRLFEKYGILSLALHPGVIHTELGRNFAKETIEAVGKAGAKVGYFPKSQGAGAATTMVGSLDPKLAIGMGETHNNNENWGAFLVDCQISDRAKPLTVSSSEAEKLWDLSEKLVNQKFSF